METKKSLYTKGFLYGVLGAFFISLILAGMRWTGLTQFSFFGFLGSMLTREFTLTSWAVGAIWHLLNGGIFGLIYCWIFKRGGGAGAGRGLMLGFAHWLAFSMIMAVSPSFHPLIPSEILEPGFFAINYGAMTAIIMLGLHLIFGYIVGNGLEGKLPIIKRPKRYVPRRYA